MSDKWTQTRFVLSELRRRGSRGIHTFELRNLYIANPSQRISELEDRGHVISHSRERLNGRAFGCRYVLVVDADTREAAA